MQLVSEASGSRKIAYFCEGILGKNGKFSRFYKKWKKMEFFKKSEKIKKTEILGFFKKNEKNRILKKIEIFQKNEKNRKK